MSGTALCATPTKNRSLRARTSWVLAAALIAVAALPMAAAHADKKSLTKVQKAAEGTFTTTVKFAGTVEGEPGVTTLEGVADYAADDSLLLVDATDFNGGVGKAEYRVIGGETVYISISAFGGAALPGAEDKDWVRIDLAETQSLLGGTMDISDLLTDQAVFVDAIDAERVGKEKVRGKRAVHYRVMLAPDPNDISQATEQDVWIRKGRIVQFQDVSTQQGEELTSTITVKKFGVSVDIEAPPEEDVFDLFAQLQGP